MPIGISNLFPDIAQRIEAAQAVSGVVDYTVQIETLILAVGILVGVALGGILFRRWL